MSTNIQDLKNQQKQPGQDIATLKPKDQVKALMQQNKTAIMAALPSHVKPERMLQVALTAAISTPELLNCYTPSLFGALVKCTQLGLEPNNALGQAYLVPFKNTKKKRKDVQVIIGYRGLITLARRSGEIQSVAAYAVRANDKFSYEYGLEEHLHHVPANDNSEITHFYAYAKYKDGGHNFEVLTNDQVQRIMRSTQSRGEYGPWKDHYEEMGRKTAIRRLAKYLPMQIELAEAVAIDERADAGMSQDMDRVLEGDYQIVGGGDDEPDAGDEPEQGEPEPQQAQASQQATSGQQQHPAQVFRDSSGARWDPNLHATGANNGPVYNKDGTFRARRGVAKQDGDAPQADAKQDGQQQTEEPASSQQQTEDAPANNQQSSSAGGGDFDDDFSLE